MTCPDGGTCHHFCTVKKCFRVATCGPLSGVYPADKWPEHPVKVYCSRPARGGANARWRWQCLTCPVESYGDWAYRQRAQDSADAHERIHQMNREALIRRRDEIEAQLARLDALPREPVEEDTCVIWFEKTFGDGLTYTYAAVKAGNGLWYTTGPRSPKGYTWDELIDWIGDDVQIWFATLWEVLD